MFKRYYYFGKEWSNVKFNVFLKIKFFGFWWDRIWLFFCVFVIVIFGSSGKIVIGLFVFEFDDE